MDKAIEGLLEKWEVNWAETSETRTSYKYNDSTRTLNTVVKSWVAAGAAAPTYSAGTTMTEEAISDLWRIRTVETQGTIPTTTAQAAYSTQYIDGATADEWIRAVQTFYVTIGAGCPNITPSPGASGGFSLQGSKKIPILDKSLEGLLERWEVYWVGASQVRTDYAYNPETGTLITKVTSWVSPASVPTFVLGQDTTQKQISALWAIRTVETAADFTSYHIQTATRVNLTIPDILESVSLVWAQSSGQSTSATEWTGDAFGSFTLQGSENGNANSSASLIPDIMPVMRSYWSHNLPATTHFFIIQSSSVTEADILTLIGGGCAAWPVFKPRTGVVQLVGGKKSVQVSASANASSSVGSLGTSYSITQGTGQGIDVSLTHATRTIPQCIHGDVSVGGSNTVNIEATADAQWTGSGGFPSSTAYKTSGIVTVEGSVSSEGLGPTSPSSVPTSGLYMIEYTAKPFQKWFGYMMIQAQVFDASVLA